MEVEKSDAEQLNSKQVDEAPEVLHNKINQDAKYCRLQEKYQQLKQDHKRLQEDMAELERQYVIMSGKYEKEKQIRIKMSNRLQSNRVQRDGLQKSATQPQETITSGSVDQAAVKEATSKDKQLISDLKLKQSLLEEKYQLHIQNADEKVQLMSQEKERLMEIVRACQKQWSVEGQQLIHKFASLEEQQILLQQALLQQLSEITESQRLEKNTERDPNEQQKLTTVNIEQEQLQQQLANLKSELFNRDKILIELVQIKEDLNNKITTINERLNNEEERAKLVKVIAVQEENMKSTHNVYKKILRHSEQIEHDRQVKNHEIQAKLQQEIDNLKSILFNRDNILSEVVQIKENFNNKFATLNKRLKIEEKLSKNVHTVHVSEVQDENINAKNNEDQVPLPSRCLKRRLSPRHLVESDSDGDNTPSQHDVRGPKTPRPCGSPTPDEIAESEMKMATSRLEQLLDNAKASVLNSLYRSAN